MAFVYLMTFVIVLVIWNLCLQYSRCGRVMNKIPGLPPLPLIGNFLSFVGRNEQFWPKVSYLLKKYYPIFRAWGFWNVAAFMCHPDDLKILLSCKKNITKAPVIYNNLKYADIDGIIASDGDRWTHRRKILNYAFTSNHLEGYSEKINKHAAKFAAELRSRGDVFVMNIVPMLLKLALAAVCDAVMDFDTSNIPAEKEREFRDAVNELFEISLYRAVRPFLPDFLMPFLPIGRRLRKVSQILNDFRWTIIKERRKYYEREGYIFENGVDKDESDTKNGLKGLKNNLSVLDLLLFAEKKGLIDDHGISEEVLTIAGAGYETTGMAMAFLLTLLAESKEQQDLARAEIFKVVGDDDCITTNHIKKMVYLERCVKEALRLFPTAPHIGRTITHDLKLSKHTLAAGALVAMSLYDLQRDDHFWPEPNKFDPDRFLPENVKQRHPWAYLPFSAGPRNCIGQKLAMNEMKLVTAHILYNFYLEPIDIIANLKLDMHFTIKTEKIDLKFIKINRE
ncbi:cytochrome P450 4C1-like [Phymastichus coffea]|uniref:cytochrome P450 4C1-like n=1 Tax=Phymastichus coffea TaxID=108790 RepID=UPI00273CD24E|nr:cytochrome P450 4C1-like [Phymastichus coffea]